MPELKPCPFCGSEKVSVVTNYQSAVECAKCMANGPLDMSIAVAVKEWNTRVNETTVGNSLDKTFNME
jgi:Lar family restriction alleviation protein